MARTLSAQEKAAKERAKRDQAIRREGKRGFRAESIATRYGLSATRVREILKAGD